MNDLILVNRTLGYIEGKIYQLKQHAEYGTSFEIQELEDVKEYIERIIKNKL